MFLLIKKYDIIALIYYNKKTNIKIIIVKKNILFTFIVAFL